MTLRLIFSRRSFSTLFVLGAVLFSSQVFATEAQNCAALLKSHNEQNPVWSNWTESKPEITKDHSATLLLKIPLEGMSLSAQELIEPSWTKATSVHFIREFSILDGQSWYSMVNADAAALEKMNQQLDPSVRSKLQFIKLDSRISQTQMSLPVPARMIEIDVRKENLASALNRILPEAQDDSLAIFAGGQFLMGVANKKMGTLPRQLLQDLEIQSVSANVDLALMSDASKYLLVQPTHTLFSASAFRVLKTHEGQSFNLGPLSLNEAYQVLAAKVKTEPCTESVCVTPIISEAPEITELVQTWRAASGIGYMEKNFLNVSLDQILEKFVPKDAQDSIRAVRALQKEGKSDGEMLRRIARKEYGGAPVVIRFSELWAAVARAVYPQMQGDVFSEQNKARVIFILNHGKQVLENEPAKAEPVKAIQPVQAVLPVQTEMKPVEQAAVSNGSLELVTAQSTAAIAKLAREQAGLSFYEAGTTTNVFMKLVELRAEGPALAIAQKKITDIGFKNHDVNQMNKGNAPKARIIEAMRVLATLVNPSIANEAASDAWVANVIASYGRSSNEAKSEVKAEASKTEAKKQSRTRVAKKSKAKKSFTLDPDKMDLLNEETITILAEFVHDQTKNSYYKANQLPVIFSSLVDKVSTGKNAELAKKHISKIDLKTADGSNSRKSRASQARVLEALRVIAVLVAPSISEDQVDESWMLSVIKSFEKQVARQNSVLISQEKAAETETQPVSKPTVVPVVISPAPLVNSFVPEKAKSAEFRLPTTRLSDSVVVRGVRDFGSYDEVLRSENFQSFMREFAQLAVLKSPESSEFKLVYLVPGEHYTTLVSFSLKTSSTGQITHLNVTGFDGIVDSEEVALYREIARAHNIKNQVITLANKKKLQVGPLKATDVQISGKVFVKLQVKHQLDRDEVEKVLNHVSAIRKENLDYLSEVEVDGRVYRVVFFVADNTLQLKTMFVKSGIKL